jgi:D-threo-aldose 1-dehydrogenase
VSGIESRPIGRSGVHVSALGLGTAPLGDLFVHVSDEDAQATLRAAVEAGVTLLDTAPYYGHGLSEHRVGRFVRSQPREGIVLATKVGRVLHPVGRGREREDPFWLGGLRFDYRFDYGYDGVMRSYEDSLQRLGLDFVELLAIHDLDVDTLGEAGFDRGLRELEQGGVRALEELRASGDVKALGLGINALGAIPRVLDVIDLDYAIVALPYTLLDQEALDEELPLCLDMGVSVIVGAVFASGILAVDGRGGTYRYEQAPAEVAARVGRMREVCERHGVSLAAAALRFPLGHPAVAAVIPGAFSAEQARQNAERFAVEIPSGVWQGLKDEGLLRADAPVPS